MGEIESSFLLRCFVLVSERWGGENIIEKKLSSNAQGTIFFSLVRVWVFFGWFLWFSAYGCDG